MSCGIGQRKAADIECNYNFTQIVFILESVSLPPIVSRLDICILIYKKNKSHIFLYMLDHLAYTSTMHIFCICKVLLSKNIYMMYIQGLYIEIYAWCLYLPCTIYKKCISHAPEPGSGSGHLDLVQVPAGTKSPKLAGTGTSHILYFTRT